MKSIQILTFFLFFCSSMVFSQKTIKHTVVEGESIYSIAKKYKVSESDIYELNPKSKGALLQLKTVLLIPNKNSKSKDKKEVNSSKNLSSETHIVESGESLYKIAKKYDISLEKLKELNPDIKPETIQIGDKIVIVAKKETTKSKKQQSVEEVKIDLTPVNKDANLCLDELGNQVHTVSKGETLYKLSKKYKVSVRDLEEMNPEIVANLPIGYEVIVKKGNVELEKNQNIVVEFPKEIEEISPENMSKAEFLIAKASQHIGTRYRGGGTTSAGFDCSGLMFSTFKNIDMTLPRSSSSMAAGAGYRIERSQAQKGDLIFFTTNGRGSINHVGMITEINGDEIKFIHSSVQAGVIISSTEEPYYKRRFVQINRVLEN
ncbi:peptidoglycan endopeptidase [Flavobacterium cheniae]|uniref:Cell wall-associated NlpC family hydrolase n=1 Tax=Flavobacterium cheniae TaxID=295428 RepID=A0A562KP88_9FLAO|nr:peptidoglycan endopeptidase [Flavobacterium cheniae]TDR23045.1 LysM domain-containing protein [Flavobacterium cheniae]TWH97095.1 cell wall-associated NlpC family hydrolase [Flavobacterium cheniae]